MVRGSKREAIKALAGKGKAMSAFKDFSPTRSVSSDLAARAGVKQAAKLKLAASLGKAASFAMWAPLIFEMSAGLTRGAVNLAGSLADKIETTLSKTSNRTMEMGGIVGEGFLAGRSATERQRALGVMQKTQLSGRGLMGNEGRQAHVGSTW